MKFFNGHWEKKKGVSVYSPAQIYEWHKTEHELTFLAPHREIANRGMTLDGVVLTFHISVAREGVFHIVVNHYEGVKKKTPSFVVQENLQPLACEETENGFVLKSGENELQITKKPFGMEFFCAGKRMTKMTGEDFSYIRTGDSGVLLYE